LTCGTSSIRSSVWRGRVLDLGRSRCTSVDSTRSALMPCRARVTAPVVRLMMPDFFHHFLHLRLGRWASCFPRVATTGKGGMTSSVKAVGPSPPMTSGGQQTLIPAPPCDRPSARVRRGQSGHQHGRSGDNALVMPLARNAVLQHLIEIGHKGHSVARQCRTTR
jgi:hypothetical protein